MTYSTYLPTIKTATKVSIVEKRLKRPHYGCNKLFCVVDFAGNEIGNGFIKKEQAIRFVESTPIFTF